MGYLLAKFKADVLDGPSSLVVTSPAIADITAMVGTVCESNLIQGSALIIRVQNMVEAGQKLQTLSIDYLGDVTANLSQQTSGEDDGLEDDHRYVPLDLSLQSIAHV
jgi:hypothetical protein